ncbi:MAG: lipopolysaccharide kinase InaA family protein [Pseudomonadales bacterium]
MPDAAPDPITLIPKQRRCAVLHGEEFHVASCWRAVLAEVGLSAGSDWAELARQPAAEVVTGSASATCYRVLSADGSVLYAKHEVYAPKDQLKHWLRPARTTIEAYAYGRIHAAEIPAAKVLAWGERRRMGCPTESLIVTLAVPDTLDLRRFVTGPWAAMSAADKRESYQQIAAQLAEQLKRAHAMGFVHHDLKWRNVLIQRTADGFLPVWIDAPRGAVWRWRAARRPIVDLGDLAPSSLDLTSVYDRMRFVCRYLGKKRSPGDASRLYRRIAARVGRRGIG